MLIPVTSTSTAEPGTLGTGLWFGHSHPCIVTGLTLGWAAVLNQYLLHSSRVALAGGMGNWTALKEMGSDGRLLEKRVGSGEPLSHVLQVKMRKQRWQ